MKRILLFSAIASISWHGAAWADEDQTETILLTESGEDNIGNFSLDISVPTAPGLVLAGAAEFEETGPSFGDDIALELSQSKSGKLNGAISARPYFLFQSMSTNSETLEEYQDDTFGAIFKRTQVSVALASETKNNVERAGAGVGVVFAPLKSTDPRMDSKYLICLRKVGELDLGALKKFERLYFNGLTDERIIDLIKVNANSLGFSASDIDRLNFRWEKPENSTLSSLVAAEHIRSQVFEILSPANTELNDIRTMAFKNILDAEKDKFVEAKFAKRKNEATVANCKSDAKKRYLNSRDLNIGIGMGAKSPDHTFDRLKSTGVSAWLNGRVPIGGQAERDDGSNGRAPLMALNFVGRLIEEDQVLIAKDDSRDALSFIGGMSASLERDNYTFKLGTSYNHRNFEDKSLKNQDFWRVSAGLDVRFSDDIWWTVEGGDVLGQTPFAEGSYFRAGFKLTGKAASLFGG